MIQTNLEIIILAAGQGSRMKSDSPKVLHKIAGISMLQQVVHRAMALNPSKIFIVVGHLGEQIIAEFAESKAPITWVWQKQQAGTAHAIMQVEPLLNADSKTLILYGDVPLIDSQNLMQLCDLVQKNQMAIMTEFLQDATGYGRIVRENKEIQKIVEHKDASPAELAITEINTGIMAIATSWLKKFLPLISNDNAQKEYYLTDIIALAKADNLHIKSCQPNFSWQILGVNSRKQLANLERIWQNHLADNLLEDGVSLADPTSINIRGNLTCGKDVFIDVGCIFIGDVVLADGVIIGAYSVIKDSKIDKQTQVQAFSHLDGVQVGEKASIGPYARLRPNAVLEAEVKVGNFVEVKASHLSKGAKVSHLSYIGDAQVGQNANIGAGVITCNYDGVNKHKTLIGKNAFVGSNSSLVAPVSLGDNSTLGAGTVLRKNLADNALGVTNGKYLEKNNWLRPTKK